VAETPKKKVGKYEVIEELGRGAMGVVYRARDPFIGRLVALKTITPGLLDNPDLLQRFYREAQAAGRLQHPNIVIIYDLGEADGLPYIAMEFLEGNSLEKLIQNTPNMPLGQKLDIIIQLCRGLEFAHKNGVVHRDVKPGNIIVMTDGTVKVVDFGIVRLSSTSMTSTGMVIGTVGYMSPEQAQGEHVDARSDLFAVGVVMYELFAYQKPFAGNNVAAVLIKIVTEDPSPLEGAAPQVPPQLCEIVHRCLNKNPAERYQSLEDLILELEPIARSMQRDMVEELVKQGQQLIEKEEFAEARPLLRNALKLDSSHSAAKTLMGKVDTEIRRLEIHPKVQKFLETGQGLFEEGKYEEAGKQFQEILKLDTQHGQAKELLEKAREEIARVASVRQGLNAGAQALNQGDLTVAESELGKVLELDAHRQAGDGAIRPREARPVPESHAPGPQPAHPGELRRMRPTPGRDGKGVRPGRRTRAAT
jgi:serine/threonine-protein kinase